MEGAADTPPPLRPETTSGRHLRRTSFQFLNSDAFAIFFLIVSLSFVFVVIVSPFCSFSFHFFKPHSARKSWDFLSLALVLFAIACGLLSKNNGENTVHEELYTASNVSEQDQKSNPSTPHQWRGYSDRTDQILLHHPPEVAGNAYWRLSGGPYMTNYISPSSDAIQHCRNLQEFEEELDVKREAEGTFSVYEKEISSSSSALHQFSVPPSMTPHLSASPTPPAVVEREIERINETDGPQCGDGDENFEPPSLPQAFQASEDEISRNEKERDTEGKESKRKKKKKMKMKEKTKQWKNSVEIFRNLLAPQHHNRNSSPPPAPLPVAVHRYLTSSIIGETRKDCLVPLPPQSPSQKLTAAVPTAAETDAHRTPFSSRTQSSTGRQPPWLPLPPPSTTPELQIVMYGEYLGTAERKSPMFRRSSDVNSKADSFIERFRAGLKLERMNSIKERQRKRRTSIPGRKGPQQ